MKKDPIILIRGANLSSAAQLALTIVEARKYFAEFKLPQPPLPSDIASFVGCELLITETEGPDRARLGKVTLTTSAGDVRYERHWTIAPGRTTT